MALTDKLTAIADAIRGKTGKTEGLTLDAMPGEIAGIQTGGGDSGGVVRSILDRSVTELSDPELTVVGNKALANCTKLQRVNFPKLTTIGNEGFNECHSLESVDTPLTTVEYMGLRNCKSLKSVNTSRLTSIGSYAFQGCTSLEAVDDILATYIQGYSFAGCTSLERLTFLNSIRIGNPAFQNSSKLSTLVIRGSNVATIDNINAFSGTPFASGGTGGTAYVPAALISDYQNATNWSTLYAAGTCNFVAIEGSEYE